MKKKFIFILFLFLILLSSCSKDDNEVKYERPDKYLERYYDGSYEDGTRVYIITLTNNESLKNKNYKISDFKLENLVLVEEVVKAKEIKNLYKKENYQKILRLTFKDLDFDTDYIVRAKMAKDSRISSIERDFEYRLSYGIDGIYLKNFNTNLKIKDMHYIDDSMDYEIQSCIFNDQKSFLENKDNYRYSYFEKELLDKYDDVYFKNNSLLYLCVYGGNAADEMSLNSIYETKDKIEIDCSGYFLTGGLDASLYYYYIVEIEGKIENKEIIYNSEVHNGLW